VELITWKERNWSKNGWNGANSEGKMLRYGYQEEAAEGNANLTPRALPGSGMSEYISRSQFANHLNIHADVKAGSRENGLGAFKGALDHDDCKEGEQILEFRPHVCESFTIDHER
jgi:hypothetical protein